MSIELKSADMQELHVLLDMYGKVYGRELTAALMADVEARCQARGIDYNTSNVRNAGRRRKYTDQTDQQILSLHDAGRTVRQIAAEIGCSTGYVQKLINAHKVKPGRCGKRIDTEAGAGSKPR